jgi:membrane-bound lytic murein transglycosylase D
VLRNGVSENLLFDRPRRLLYATVFFILISMANTSSVRAAEGPFPLLAGLETAVEFWKEIFTRYGASDVVLFDPLDPATIYSVVRVPEGEEGRRLVEKERARIIAEHELNEGDGRVRSQRGAREQFMEGLRRSGRYMEQMRRILAQEGVPAELAYLPLVESSFNVLARSSVGALGMWQFMPATGKKFLRIDETIDERRDPYISTRAAARLLKQNHRLLGNWPLAITAYNHGTEGIFRAIEEVASENLVEMIRRYQSPSFGFASKNFYAEFLAAVEIASNRDSYFPSLRMHQPWTHREVAIDRSLPVQSVLKPATISADEFFAWNPAFDTRVAVLPIGYSVRIAPEKVDRFIAALRKTFAKPAKKSTAMAARSRRTIKRLEAALEQTKRRATPTPVKAAGAASTARTQRRPSQTGAPAAPGVRLAQR